MKKHVFLKEGSVLKMCECFFCKCIQNKDYQLENDLAIARFDDYPVSNGHLEVVPKRHIKDWWGITK